MHSQIKSLALAAAFVGALAIFSTNNSYAAVRSPIVGKGSIVSKRVFLGRTFSRSNSHAIRIKAIRDHLQK